LKAIRTQEKRTSLSRRVKTVYKTLTESSGEDALLIHPIFQKKAEVSQGFCKPVTKDISFPNLSIV